jgi:hypothetical protein
MTRSLYFQSEPPPRIVARRTVELPLRRTLEVTVIEDGGGRADVWLRLRNADGHLVGQVHSKPSALRAIAGALSELAGELGIAP